MFVRPCVIFLTVISLFLNMACWIGSQVSRVNEAEEILAKGNDAYRAKDFDLAIQFYDRGLEILPNQITLVINKSAALRGRAVGQYNNSIRSADEGRKKIGIQQAGDDLLKASELSSLAVQRIKHPLHGTIEAALNPVNIELIVLQVHSENLRLLAGLVDQTRAEEAFRAILEYVAIEPVKQKALEARLAGCKLLLETKNSERAVIEYKKILAQDPVQLDAILGVGLALSQTGDLSRFDEGKVYLRRFLELAPNDHPMKKDIERTLGYMQ